MCLIQKVSMRVFFENKSEEGLGILIGGVNWKI